MAIEVPLGNPNWRCVRAVSMQGGCAVPDCPIGRVCGEGARAADLQHHDYIDREAPARVRIHDAAQRVALGAGFEAVNTVPALAAILRAELAAAGGGAIATRMVDRFLRGTGGVVTHDDASPLGGFARRSGNVPAYLAAVQGALARKIASQAATARSSFDLAPGDLPWVEFPLLHAAPGMPAEERASAAVIGGTKGNKVFLRNLTVNRTTRAWRVEARIEICDHFGVDETDLYSPGLVAFWKLQHARRGDQRPFVNLIVLNQALSGRY